MEKYVLTQDLVTGNELIDSEHRKIFDEVNTLLDACSEGERIRCRRTAFQAGDRASDHSNG